MRCCAQWDFQTLMKWRWNVVRQWCCRAFYLVVGFFEDKGPSSLPNILRFLSVPPTYFLSIMQATSRFACMLYTFASFTAWCHCQICSKSGRPMLPPVAMSGCWFYSVLNDFAAGSGVINNYTLHGDHLATLTFCSLWVVPWVPPLCWLESGGIHSPSRLSLAGLMVVSVTICLGHWRQIYFSVGHPQGIKQFS